MFGREQWSSLNCRAQEQIAIHESEAVLALLKSGCTPSKLLLLELSAKLAVVKTRQRLALYPNWLFNLRYGLSISIHDLFSSK